MRGITFTKSLNNGIYPNKQLAYGYFIADCDAARRVFEIRPITAGHLLYSLGRNYSRVIYYGLLRLLFWCGFIQMPEFEAFSWRKHFFVIPGGFRHER